LKGEKGLQRQAYLFLSFTSVELTLALSPRILFFLRVFHCNAHAMQIETFLQHSACFGKRTSGLLYNSLTLVEQEENGATQMAQFFLGLFLRLFSFLFRLSSYCIIKPPSVLFLFSITYGVVLLPSFPLLYLSISFVTKLHLDTPLFISLSLYLQYSLALQILLRSDYSLFALSTMRRPDVPTPAYVKAKMTPATA